MTTPEQAKHGAMFIYSDSVSVISTQDPRMDYTHNREGVSKFDLVEHLKGLGYENVKVHEVNVLTVSTHIFFYAW